MVKKKLFVCGCSFMQSSYMNWNNIRGADWPEYPMVDDIEKINLSKSLLDELKRRGYEHYASFLDRYAKEKDFQYTNLAVGGISNFFIRLQIDQAINSQADYVIIGATDPGRFEIPVQSIDVKVLNELNSKKYIISTNFSHNINSIPAELRSAVKYYQTYIQDHDIDSMKSYWILREGLIQLKKKKIPYVFIPGPLREHDWTENHIVWPKDEYQPWDYQYGYHYHGNHNNMLSHNDYFETLFKITSDWKNGI